MSKDPDKRFADADAMRQALLECADDEVETPDQPSGPSPRAHLAILERIREQVEKQGDFPATSQYIARVTAAVMSPSTSAESIAKKILRDFALTNRILRTVNSLFYSSSCGQIRTILHAVVILGVDTVLSVAGGLSIFEHFHNRSDMEGLKSQAIKALMTALHTSKLAHTLALDNAEEAFICGMLHHLGRLLTAFYFRDEQQQIEGLVNEGISKEQASRKVMRLSYGEISQGMTELWNIPETIVHTVRGLPPDHRGGLADD